MIKILKYSLADLLRSRWSLIYFLFYLVLGFVLLFLNTDLSKAIITLMNIIVILTPLIGMVFGIMYFYNSREFTELLMAQPIKRSWIYFGQYLGIALSLSASVVLGLGIPFMIYGLTASGEIWNFVTLLVNAVFLTFIFTSLSVTIALFNTNKLKGFGFAILVWLFFAVIYDGILMVTLLWFSDYPIDSYAMIASLLNPIDLSRMMILLKLDISALLGYTGALFQKFFGSQLGVIISLITLTLWIVLPVSIGRYRFSKMDM